MRLRIGIIVFSLLANVSMAGDLPDPVSPAAFARPDLDRALLGRLLFYDPVLSGNRNISCATCHHPSLGSGDGMSLSIGEGGIGLGPDRVARVGQEPAERVPRNAPALWNVGAHEYHSFFFDGRIEVDQSARFGLRAPADRPIARALPSALAAQVLLPMLSATEMAGQPGENPVADAVAAGDAARGWDMLTARVAAIPEYRRRLAALNGPGETARIEDIAIALAEFIAYEFRACDSPFDAYLGGDRTAMTTAQIRGMDLFYGKARCESCHSGPLQTDHDFHAIGVPQIGPGKGGNRPFADLGRQRVTGNPDDRYRFRTPSLRNVMLTAPYGHSGAYATLDAMVRHHLDPVTGLMSYDRRQALLHDLPADDWRALDDQAELIDIAAAIELPPIPLSEAEIDDLLAFLSALTDRHAAQGRLGIPESVPSGLPIDR